MTHFLPPLGVLVFLAACNQAVKVETGSPVEDTGDSSTDTGGDTSPETGTETSTETSTETDTETDTETGEAPPPECGVYSGFAGVGTVWGYAIAGANVEGTNRMEVTAVRGSDWQTEELTRLEEDEGDFSVVVSRTRRWACEDAGWWLNEERTEISIVDRHGQQTTHDVSVHYDPPLLWLPVQLTVGDAWTTRAEGTRVTDGVETTFGYDIDYVVVEETKVGVPAGYFDALDVRGLTDTPRGAREDHRLVVDGIGAAQVGDYFLLDSYTPGAG